MKILVFKCSRCGYSWKLRLEDGLAEISVKNHVYDNNLCVECSLRESKMIMHWNEGNVLSAIRISRLFVP